ncbi:hypothetical protein LMG27174_05683 [Paraburkholderia rhynchosiae]|uniref:Uncharacterized protein n=1 Tax=Paraburkholderia rhynchosiae TaxID=487049 RepID=A0A6J5CAP6_9BURK|nr:hypothetical protein LMG27174_05683 [Paraburkholderia rhynchosiae]
MTAAADGLKVNDARGKLVFEAPIGAALTTQLPPIHQHS